MDKENTIDVLKLKLTSLQNKLQTLERTPHKARGGRVSKGRKGRDKKSAEETLFKAYVEDDEKDGQMSDGEGEDDGDFKVGGVVGVAVEQHTHTGRGRRKGVERRTRHLSENRDFTTAHKTAPKVRSRSSSPVKHNSVSNGLNRLVGSQSKKPRPNLFMDDGVDGAADDADGGGGDEEDEDGLDVLTTSSILAVFRKRLHKKQLEVGEGRSGLV